MLFHLFATALAATATANALAPPIRAGGPSTNPIPANCTLNNTLPQAANTTIPISGWQLSAAFFANHTIYQAYYNSSTQQAQDCFSQCYGLEGCKSVLYAHNVLTPDDYFGTSPFLAAMGCQLFDTYACPEEFVAAPQGQYVNEAGVNIACPT